MPGPGTAPGTRLLLRGTRHGTADDAHIRYADRGGLMMEKMAPAGSLTTAMRP